jgi:hypothetical protein
MYHQSNPRNGLCHYTYNVDKNEMEFIKIEHNKHQNIFEKIDSCKIDNINLMKKASKAIRNQHICSEIFPNLKEHINKYLAINLTSENIKKDIEEIYTHPKIVKEENKNNKFNQKIEEEETIIELMDFLNYERNIILQGKQECGKTTILNMINFTFLKHNNNFIPIYIPGNELYNVESIEIFIAKISDYLNKFYKKSILEVKKMIFEEGLPKIMRNSVGDKYATGLGADQNGGNDEYGPGFSNELKNSDLTANSILVQTAIEAISYSQLPTFDIIALSKTKTGKKIKARLVINGIKFTANGNSMGVDALEMNSVLTFMAKGATGWKEVK